MTASKKIKNLKKFISPTVFCITIGLASAFALAKITNPWNHITAPTTSSAESIGAYDAGCLRGAQDLPIDGNGYQVMRLSRRRNWGHPALLKFLEDLGGQIKSLTNQDILVGDMGQPRGGPTFSGHASHQTGLDVDVWFLQPPPGKIYSKEERETTGAPSMVIPEFESLSKNWTDEKITLLKTAAENDQVERIFVNPVIKKHVCEMAHNLNAQMAAAQQAWIRKLRPWWFHEEHFHVRLKCQPGSPHCTAQAPPPEGDGCGEELTSWFTSENKKISHFYRTCKVGEVLNLSNGSKIVCSGPTMPHMPVECESVLKEN